MLWEKEKLWGAKAESTAWRWVGAAISNKARPVRGGLSGKVTFEQRNPTGIRPMVKENNSIGQVVKDKLTLIGVTGEIFVFDVKGVQQLKVEATGGETTVNIAHLPAGVYVVKTGKQNFKFIKK